MSVKSNYGKNMDDLLSCAPWKKAQLQDNAWGAMSAGMDVVQEIERMLNSPRCVSCKDKLQMVLNLMKEVEAELMSAAEPNV